MQKGIAINSSSCKRKINMARSEARENESTVIILNHYIYQNDNNTAKPSCNNCILMILDMQDKLVFSINQTSLLWESYFKID